MNNEIKEILNNLKYVSNDIKVHIKDGYIIREEIPSSIPKELRLDSYSAKVLLNYITNLQERIDKAIDYIEKEYQDNIIITDYADNPITPQELYGELLDILKGDSDE